MSEKDEDEIEKVYGNRHFLYDVHEGTAAFITLKLIAIISGTSELQAS